MILFNAWNKSRQLEKRIVQQMKGAQTELLLEELALTSTLPGTRPNRKIPIVVSLTSYELRIGTLHKTIESLFRQTTQADRIVLWLSASDFSLDSLPIFLKRQMDRGLEVEFFEQDLACYNKFYYTLEQYPESLILTVDDDIMYPPDMIEQLYSAYLRHPRIIHCHRAHGIVLGADGKPIRYKKWNKSIGHSLTDPLVFTTGCGGVLYFPGCFHKQVGDVKTFMKLAPKADDIWLKTMTLMNDVISSKLKSSSNWPSRFLTVEGSQERPLKRTNKHKVTGNDAKFRAVLDHFELRLPCGQGD